MTTKGRLLLLLPLFLVIASGCGYRNRATPSGVSGHITYKGKPLPGGTVTFYPGSGGAYTGTIDKDGKYSVADVPAGTMTVSVETSSVKPRPNLQYGKGAQKMEASPGPGGSAGTSPSGPTGENYVEIPAKYANPQTSGLSATLTAGSQVKDFALD
jgi:hypothetical protein